MLRKTFLCALASAAMIPTSAVFAHPGGGGGGGAGGPPAGVGGGMGNVGGSGGNGAFGPGGPGYGSMNNPGVDVRDQARMNSQGPGHASPTGVANANQNSVLARTTGTSRVTSGALSGLSQGATLYSNGTAVGTVQQIRTTANGSVAMVVVKGTNGALYAVPATKLSYAGGILSTTSRLNGVNGGTTTGSTTGTLTRDQARLNSQGPLHASPTGIAHANANSVLAGATGGATLTGLTAGTALLQNGSQIGTVQRVITNGQGVVTRVLVSGTNGRLYSLSPRNLSYTGGILSTTTPLRTH